MLRKFIARALATETSTGAVRADSDAHGCPACPHSPKVLHDMDDEGPATLLPLHQTDIEGHSFEHMAIATEGPVDFDDDIADFDLD